MTDGPPHLTMSEKAERNRQIAAARARGASWPVIAETFGVSVRQARRCEHEAQATASTLSLDEPEVALREALDALTWASDQLADVAEEADNSSAQVAAISKRADLAVRKLDLLARAELDPGEPGGGAASEAPYVTVIGAACATAVAVAFEDGRRVSTLRLRCAGVTSVFPAASLARTLNVSGTRRAPGSPAHPARLRFPGALRGSTRAWRPLGLVAGTS